MPTPTPPATGACMYVCIYAYMNVMPTPTPPTAGACVYVCMYVYLYTYIHLYVYIRPIHTPRATGTSECTFM